MMSSMSLDTLSRRTVGTDVDVPSPRSPSEVHVPKYGNRRGKGVGK